MKGCWRGRLEGFLRARRLLSPCTRPAKGLPPGGSPVLARFVSTPAARVPWPACLSQWQRVTVGRQSHTEGPHAHGRARRAGRRRAEGRGTPVLMARGVDGPSLITARIRSSSLELPPGYACALVCCCLRREDYEPGSGLVWSGKRGPPLIAREQRNFHFEMARACPSQAVPFP